MASDDWRWADPSGQQRLIGEEQLRAAIAAGTVPTNALVWRKGWKEWKHANEVGELTGLSVPEPPDFVIAIQDELEGKVHDAPAEPPAPPRYVPITKRTETKRRPEVKPAKPPAPKPTAAPKPPPPKAKEEPKKPEKKEPIATVIGVPAIQGNGLRIRTPNVSPAPPPMPTQATPSAPTTEEKRPPVSKRATLLDPLSLGPQPEIPPPSTSHPIVAPAPVPSASAKLAVTRPPPFDVGAAEIAEMKMPPPSVPRVSTPMEELSGSVLLDEPDKARSSVISGSDLVEAEPSVVKAPPLGAGKQTSTLLGMPAVAPAEREPARTIEPTVTPPVSLEEPPPDPPSDQRVWDLRELKRKTLERPRAQLIAGGALAALVLLGLVGVMIKAFGGSAEDTTTTTVASSAPLVTSAPPVVSSSAPPAPPPAITSCAVAGDAHVISPRAVVAAGVEVTTLGSSIALGFASSPTEAMITDLDPATMGASNVRRTTSPRPIKRVTPEKNLAAAIDSDDKADKIKGRRAVLAFDVGGEGGSLVFAPRGSNDTKVLWPLESEAPVEALRSASVADQGVVLAYRHAGAIWVGLAKGALERAGAPTRVPSLGPQVGSPAIASSEGNVLVVWADRAAASEPWGLRSVSWRPPAPPSAPRSFKLPEGGLGEHAMSPGVAALPGGSFLLVWTEGPVSSHQVRAQVLRADGAPASGAFTVSAEGVNAGQGQAAVLPDGRGVVAFLASAGKVFEARATPIRCN